MDLDQWLRDRLAAGYRRSAGEPVPPARYATAAPPRRNVMLKGLAVVAGSKAALAATAVVAFAGVGVGVKAATTGDPNPVNWGTQVTQQVTTCKAELAAGDHGIGQCVSNFAKQHGQATGQGHGSPAAHPTPHAHPTPPAHPTGPPSSAPNQSPPTPPPHPTPRAR